MEENKMDLTALKNSATEIKSVDEAHPSTVGGDWYTQPTQNQDIETENSKLIVPELPDDSNLSESYDGPGIVIENTDEQENKDNDGIRITPGLNPTTLSNIDSYMADLDSEIETIKKEVEQTQTESTEDDTDDEDNQDDMSEDEFDKKYNEAKILIDKTGMGSVINFTDEEHKKLERVKTIKLEEIETVQLQTIKIKKPDKKTDVDKILKRTLNSFTTSIVLPASGYTAVMKGCSTYELISMIQNTQNVLINMETKWSLIHNKIVETSLGDMDFNTFLMNTAAIDYNVFLYGIICSTYPDDDKITLTCTNDTCKKDFEHGYTVQSLIRAEKMSQKLQEKVMNIIDASHTEDMAKHVHGNAPVSSIQRVKLPISGVIVELYIQPSYDFIYKSIKELSVIKEEKYQQASMLSSVIKTAYVPDGDEYIEFSNPIDIVKILYNLKDSDILIISKMSDKLMEDITMEFGFMNIKCPHCNKHELSAPVDLETILFFKYQQAMSTQIK